MRTMVFSLHRGNNFASDSRARGELAMRWTSLTLMDMGYTFTSVRLPFHPTVKLWWSISAPGRNSSTVSRKLRRSWGV